MNSIVFEDGLHDYSCHLPLPKLLWDPVAYNHDIIRNDYGPAVLYGNGAPRKDVTIPGNATQVYIEKCVAFDPSVFIRHSPSGGWINTGAFTTNSMLHALHAMTFSER